MLSITRTLIFSMLYMFIAYITSANAMSVGNDTLKSDLNQRLEFVVELSARDVSEFDSLLVSVSSDPHQGKVRYVLSYELIQSYAGKSPRITSKKPVREPILQHFTLSFSWQQGQLVRDYALLLDLPGN